MSRPPKRRYARTKVHCFQRPGLTCCNESMRYRKTSLRPDETTCVDCLASFAFQVYRRDHKKLLVEWGIWPAPKEASP